MKRKNPANDSTPEAGASAVEGSESASGGGAGLLVGVGCFLGLVKQRNNGTPKRKCKDGSPKKKFGIMKVFWTIFFGFKRGSWVCKESFQCLHWSSLGVKVLQPLRIECGEKTQKIREKI